MLFDRFWGALEFGRTCGTARVREHRLLLAFGVRPSLLPNLCSILTPVLMLLPDCVMPSFGWALAARTLGRCCMESATLPPWRPPRMGSVSALSRACQTCAGMGLSKMRRCSSSSAMRGVDQLMRACRPNSSGTTCVSTRRISSAVHSPASRPPQQKRRKRFIAAICCWLSALGSTRSGTSPDRARDAATSIPPFCSLKLEPAPTVCISSSSTSGLSADNWETDCA
mmetsp:Transcript_62953/g.159764  ORF Transcript_62953/g.159764 Transcript_62953/m.159764 type:complete len:226 (+) Transcript_62953:216-893(+)